MDEVNMSYSSELYKTRKWYISHEILGFEKSNKNEVAEHLTIWENLILIRANDPEEAYQKSIAHGRLQEEPVEIDGEEGYCKFLGLKNLFLIYDQIEDGIELEWYEREISVNELSTIIKIKENLHAFNLEPSGAGGPR